MMKQIENDIFERSEGESFVSEEQKGESSERERMF